jgi:Cysteine-rich secretory protein family
MTGPIQVRGRKVGSKMNSAFSALLGLSLLLGSPAAAQSEPADQISEFRLKQGEGRVTIDATLNRIALDQAKAMAASDKLDHEVLGSFSSRIASANAGAAAENIAYGYDSFEKTLEQWIGSSSHRKNLLLHNATRVGVASARSEATRRTYWAMEIAGGYEPRPSVKGKKAAPASRPKASAQSCRIKLMGLCL